VEFKKYDIGMAECMDTINKNEFWWNPATSKWTLKGRNAFKTKPLRSVQKEQTLTAKHDPKYRQLILPLAIALTCMALSIAHAEYDLADPVLKAV